MQVGGAPTKTLTKSQLTIMCKLGCGAQQREIGSVISTDNASWRGPNKEADEKSAYNTVQVGVRGPPKRNWIRNFYRQCKLAGPQPREFRKEILQAMQVGEEQQI